MIRRCLLSWVVALTLAGALARPVRAQAEPGVPTIPFDGPDVFCYLLKSRGFTAIPTVAELRHDPKDTLLILFGKPDLRPLLRDTIVDLRKFQLDGGSVLLASDYAQDLSEYGVRIAGATPVCVDPHYRDTPQCPLIKSLEAKAPAAFHPLTHGLATNRPSYFKKVFIAAGRRPPALQPLAGLSSFWAITISGTLEDIRRRDEQLKHLVGRPNGTPMLPYAYLADQDAPGAGRALLMAGNGGFTNGMLLQTDNDNFFFATHCLDWLGKRPDGKTPRKHALFIVDGKVIPSFDVALKPPPLPVPPIPAPTIAVVNQLVHGIEDEGILFRILDDTVDVRAAVRVALVLLTLALVGYGAKKLMDQRHHSERGTVIFSGPYAVPADTSPPIAQRARAQIEHDALGAEVRALVRAWFLDTCGIPVAAWDPASPAPVPDASVTGGLWQRYRIRRQIKRLGYLAGAVSPALFSWPEMVRLTKTLHALNAAVREGRLRFAGCSPGENS